MAGAGVATMAIAGTFTAGCPGGEDDNLPPGGAVYVEHYTVGTNERYAEATAVFFRDFLVVDPADDITVNPYLDIPIGECVDVFVAGALPAFTETDAGDVSITGAIMVVMTYNGLSTTAYNYNEAIPEAGFPYQSFVGVEISGSADVDATSWPSGLATGDELVFTAPAGINSSRLSIPGTAALELGYASVASEILMISFANGNNGKQCRLDPGSGGSSNFTVPADVITSLPATGQVTIFSYNQREETAIIGGVESKIGLFGTNYKILDYQKL